MINSYSTIFNLGHAAVATLLHGPVIIEEKIDGSQISFRVRDEPRDVSDVKVTFEDAYVGVTGGTHILEVRSKGAMINVEAPEEMFKKAVEILLALFEQGKIPVGYTFRGEYLSKPTHNIAAYDRVPKNHIIIFDIEKGEQAFLNSTDKKAMAETLGFETVPMLHPEGSSMEIQNAEEIRAFLNLDSILGGQKVEGVVIKPAAYDLFGRDKKVLMGKFVSEAFKETHAAEWKKLHGPKAQTDILNTLALMYGAPARWFKALQHLREAGQITDSPKDIGALFKEVPADIRKECEQEIKEVLFKWAWTKIARSATAGLAEWYKDLLLKKQFENPSVPPVCDHEFIVGDTFASACVKCGNEPAPAPGVAGSEGLSDPPGPCGPEPAATRNAYTGVDYMAPVDPAAYGNV